MNELDDEEEANENGKENGKDKADSDKQEKKEEEIEEKAKEDDASSQNDLGFNNFGGGGSFGGFGGFGGGSSYGGFGGFGGGGDDGLDDSSNKSGGGDWLDDLAGPTSTATPSLYGNGKTTEEEKEPEIKKKEPTKKYLHSTYPAVQSSFELHVVLQVLIEVIILILSYFFL